MKENLEQYETALIIGCGGRRKDKEVNSRYLVDILKGDGDACCVGIVGNNGGFGGVGGVSGDKQEEKIQELVSKFNNNVASIWNEETKNIPDQDQSNVSSIWSFSHSSPSTSWVSPSPKLPSPDSPGNSIWRSLGLSPFTSDDQQPQEKKNLNSTWKSYKEASLSPSESLSTSKSISFDCSLGYSGSWLSSPVPLATKCEENNTSLSNHRGDSLFVEVSSLKSQSKSDDSTVAAAALRISMPYVGSPADGIKNLESESGESSENLLTSSKTHFHPIGSDSIDNDSDETLEADAEVTRLVAGKTEPIEKKENKFGQFSSVVNDESSKPTSGLTTLMGPFDGSSLSSNKGRVELMNAIDNMISLRNFSSGKGNSLPGEDEDEFGELCTLLNQVLSEGRGKDDGISTRELVASTLRERIGQCNNGINNNANDEHNKFQPWSSLWNSFAADSPNVPSKETDRVAFAEPNANAAARTDREKSFGSSFSKDFESGETKEEDTYKMNFGLTYSEDLEAKQNDPMNRWPNEDYSGYDVHQNLDGNGELEEEWSSHCGDLNHRNLTSSEDKFINPFPVYYSEDLEEEWRKEASLQNKINISFANKTGAVQTSISRYPCSFFLQGNCLRSDCKYSHDLKSITCKFWEESTCYKGDLCPFLHGYPDYDERSRKGKAGDPKYAIESESDFPALLGREATERVEGQDEWWMRKRTDKESPQVVYRFVKKKRRKGGQGRNENAI